MHPWHHSVSSARKHGGKPEDYLKLHNWFDQSKEHYADFRHRALRHHTLGIYQAEQHFGATVVNSDGRHVPTRILGEQHVKEDLGRIPTLADWLSNIRGQPWMHRHTPRAEPFAHQPDQCPSNHWNRGDDVCADCGAWLG